MNLDNLFVKKEAENKSVSLTLLLLSATLLVIGAGLQMAKVIDDLSILPEFFYANAGLYFGRRISGKSGSSLSGKEE